MSEPALHWVDGQRGAQVPADDRGLLYGDGVFRTLRVDDAVADDLPGQLAHLLADAAALGLPQADPAILQADIETAAKTVGQGMVRMTLTRGSGGHGYAPSGAGPVRRVMIARPLQLIAQPQHLALLPPMAVLGNHSGKHLNRLVQVQAATQTPAWASAGLLQNTAGCLVCATESNIFAIDEAKRLMTPPATDGALMGRMRARVLAAAQRLGVHVSEQSLPREALQTMTGLFCASSVRGLQWVTRVSDVTDKDIAGWGTAGAGFAALRAAIDHPAHSE